MNIEKARILHLGTNDKFLWQAVDVFEKVNPGFNDVCILNIKNKKVPCSKKTNIKVLQVKYPQFQLPRVSSRVYKKYDIVVFHSFDSLIFPEIFAIPKNVAKFWVGWGFDYYSEISSPKKLLLPKTYQYRSDGNSKRKNNIFLKMTRFIAEMLGVKKNKCEAISKLDFFAPVIPEEYDMLKSSRKWSRFPDFLNWNYGTIEDHFLKGFDDVSDVGDAILLGNSASLTCNHLDAFEILARLETNGRKIVVPLSYGGEAYADKVCLDGGKYFGDNFLPLRGFLPISEYVKTISQCGFVVMNHNRQQGLGNIVIMLYLGAKVFLRKENPLYENLISQGFIISAVQDLDKNPDLIKEKLAKSDAENNKKLIIKRWSREASVNRTLRLIEAGIARSTSEEGGANV